jgi:hypothetical protein
MDAACHLCACRRLEAGPIAILEPRALDDTPEELPSEFLVVIECGPDRWWEIAWRDPATGLIDGAWRYTPDLRDAQPIAWCSLPPIAPALPRRG